MLITDTLDVGIGLALVYLLLSIIMTSVSESIEAVFKMRAVDLETAIGEIMQRDPSMLSLFYQHSMVSALYAGAYTPPPTPKPGMPMRRNRGGNLPSYIGRDTFSAALMDLSQSGAMTATLKGAMTAIAGAAGVDLDARRREIESWYDNVMDRAAGWYKRRTQWRLFLLGLGVALVGNVNTVTIANYLATVPQARKAVEMAAIEAATHPSRATSGKSGTTTGTAIPPPPAPPGSDAGTRWTGTSVALSYDMDGLITPGPADAASSDDSYVRDYDEKLREIGLPIGWSKPSWEQTIGGFPCFREHPDGAHARDDEECTDEDSSMYAKVPRAALAALELLAGYLFTTFAVMLGAPFWFDLLGRLIVVRSTVKPKEKSPVEASKD